MRVSECIYAKISLLADTYVYLSIHEAGPHSTVTGLWRDTAT